nr:hypothetical protein [Tanacetum cinerariifolium]
MDRNSSLEKNCLGEEVVVILSDEVEGSGDWNFSKFQETANSGKKKETKAMVFLPNGNRKIKFCLEHKVKRGNKAVKKELIVALRGEIYFVKFIINPEEYDVEPGVIFDRSFLRMTKEIIDFGVGTITIYPDIDPLLEDTEEEEKRNDDWDRLLDFNIDDVPLLGEEGLLPFVCRMGKSSRNKKRAMENLNFFYQDVGTSSSVGGHLTQEKVAKEAIATRMSRKFTLLEEERPIIETMAYQDKYKKILDEVWKDKVELDGKIIKEEEEAVKRIKGEALKGKDDPGSFIFPIRLEGHVNENALADTGLFSTFDGFCHQTFRAARSDIMRNAESDSDDEEDYQIKRNKFGAPIYGPKPAPYLNCNDPYERSLAIQTVTNPFQKISVWKKVVSFLGSLLLPLKNVNWKPDYKFSYTKDEEAIGQWRTEIRLTDPYMNIYLQGFTTKKTDQKLWEHMMIRVDHQDPNAQDNMKPWKRHIYSPYIINWDVLNKIGCDGEIDDMLRIRLRKAGSDEEIITSVAWIRAFNINEPIYAELCHEFYSTYEFDKVCADDVLQTKKIIKFRLGGQDVVRSLSTLIYYRDLDTITFRDLIDSDGKLISEDPQPGVPRVGIPRPPRASMQDLYDRMGRMEIHQEAIERIKKGLLRFGDVKFLLVTLYTKLKILDSTFDDKTSCEHMKGHNQVNNVTVIELE